MSRQKGTKTIGCTHFTWKLIKRGSIYYADGRSGKTNLGKHSLGVKTEEEAIRNLQRLDIHMAQERGLIPRPTVPQLNEQTPNLIGIEDGWSRFLDQLESTVIMGSRSPNTLTRYREIRDKHVEYCRQRNIMTWPDFTQEVAEKYGSWLVTSGAATRSWHLAMTTILSTMKWLIKRKLLDARYRVHIPLPKPSGTDTYCYTRREMCRMLEFCKGSQTGQYLRPILIALATTGMRIGELCSLRWSDIDFEDGVVHIQDERHSGRKEVRGRVRTTKGRSSRQVPLNHDLRSTLLAMKRHTDGFVFHGPKGASILPKRVLSAFKRAVRDPLISEFPTTPGDVGFKHGTIHSFRHYFVSEAFRMNFTETNIMDWVGHKDSEMVHKYRHLRPGETQKRMQTINFLAVDTGSTAS